MSWCRWGSKCQNTVPPLVDDLVCPRETCPGSSLYIWEEADDRICCGCGEEPFVATSEEEMWDHIEEHVAAGAHVRPSIRRGAKREVA